MGAAASMEALKPVDASDLLSGNLNEARAEVMRLRECLGAFAKGAGFAEVIYDASDLVLGENESEDFTRCIDEVKHIRAALRLSTQATKRRERPAYTPKSFFEMEDDGEDGSEGSDSESSSDENDKGGVDEKMKGSDSKTPGEGVEKSIGTSSAAS